MYLTDFQENTLHDVITKIEPDLFKKVTGLSVADFNLLVNLGVFNSIHMNQEVFAFRRYEDAPPALHRHPIPPRAATHPRSLRHGYHPGGTATLTVRRGRWHPSIAYWPKHHLRPN